MIPRVICQLILVAVFFASTGVRSQSALVVEPIPVFSRGSRIIFQGDSITDGTEGVAKTQTTFWDTDTCSLSRWRRSEACQVHSYTKC
jgi:hypothetical protein